MRIGVIGPYSWSYWSSCATRAPELAPPSTSNSIKSTLSFSAAKPRNLEAWFRQNSKRRAPLYAGLSLSTDSRLQYPPQGILRSLR